MRHFFKRKDLLNMFYRANEDFIENEIMSIANDTSERNLCAHLSNCIEKRLRSYELSDYYVDVEYNRNGNETKTIDGGKIIVCDLIVHSRGTKRKDNLIALEMKKLPCSKKELKSDRDRLKTLTKHDIGETFQWNGIELPKQVCDYEIGIYYIIDRTNKTITFELYADGKQFKEEKYQIEYFFERPLDRNVSYDENKLV